MSPRPAPQRSALAGAHPAIPTAARPAGPAPAPDQSSAAPSSVDDLAIAVDHVAPNPYNTRDVDAKPEKIASLAESIRQVGQLQDSAVVTRTAFLRIFPEAEQAIGAAPYVQVIGARRRAAARTLGANLNIVVRDELAQSRTRFLAATFAENIDREEYDPIEEARAVKALVAEYGSGEATAAELRKTGAWITQRLNLLKLVAEVQSAVGAREVPLRVVRRWHTLDPDLQRLELERWLEADRRRRSKEEQVGAEKPEGTEQAKRPTRSPYASAVRKLGGSPIKIAEALRGELSIDDRRVLAAELMRAD